MAEQGDLYPMGLEAKMIILITGTLTERAKLIKQYWTNRGSMQAVFTIYTEKSKLIASPQITAHIFLIFQPEFQVFSCKWWVPPEDHNYFLSLKRPLTKISQLQCDYSNRGDKVDHLDYGKITIHSMNVGCGQSTKCKHWWQSNVFQ